MFEVGEYIVYGCKGVCQVEEITHIDIPGSNKDRLSLPDRRQSS